MAYEKFRGIEIDNLNANSPKAAFQLREVYDQLYSENIPSYSFYNDKSMFYGRIDSVNSTVHVNERFLKQIKSRKSKNVMCLNFVADAFTDMKKFIKTTSSSKLIKDNFLTTKWDACTSWDSPHIFYNKKMDALYKIFVASSLSFKNNDQKIQNIENFIDVFFNDFYPSLEGKTPITKSGTIMSKYYNPTSTGLCIEISKDSFSLDYQKLKKYLKSNNYTFYTITAAKYGFLVDQNAPWRLVANLNSKPMQAYMAKYDINLENVFDLCYIKTHKYDIDNLKVYIKQMYDAFTTLSPILIKKNEKYTSNYCRDLEQAEYIAVPREKISSENYDQKYGDLFWLRLYYRIRLVETNTSLPDSVLTAEMFKIGQMYKTLDYSQVLEYINDNVKSQLG